MHSIVYSHVLKLTVAHAWWHTTQWVLCSGGCKGCSMVRELRMIVATLENSRDHLKSQKKLLIGMVLCINSYPIIVQPLFVTGSAKRGLIAFLNFQL